MSEPIKRGDLVQVILPAPCCGKDDTIGHIFLATTIDSHEGNCRRCGRARPKGTVVAGDGDGFYHLFRLKRIPPPEDLGIVDEKTEEPSHVG